MKFKEKSLIFQDSRSLCQEIISEGVWPTEKLKVGTLRPPKIF